ncbi:DUF1353 domain-containing protein [Parasphingorhabdus sp.]|uniref:DUF1353 domain-containing protein n=1 Tax=Parasphingorhabdus sp. TaxID=2709688 RepID=UPI002B27B0FE|nr:DUF1353 domain-containing protein [Parasphingorhabdus sp.]
MMRYHSILIGILVFGTPVAAQAESSWGRFEGDVRGVWVEAEPRPKFKLTDDFIYHDPSNMQWTAPSGAIVDGASIPRLFWSVIGNPFGGRYWKASVIHDHYCDAKTRSDKATHRSFYYAMLADGVPVAKADLMYWAVRTFGPAWKTVTRVVVKRDCSSGTCKDVRVNEKQTLALKSPDLGNPVVEKLAIAKFNAILKTLKTSDGEVLDIGAMGNVSSGLDSIDANSQNYREIFNSDDLMNRPGSLGLLSDEDLSSYEDVPGWKDGQLPDGARLNDPATVAASPDSSAFILRTPGDAQFGDRLDIDQQMLNEAQIQIQNPQAD